MLLEKHQKMQLAKKKKKKNLSLIIPLPKDTLFVWGFFIFIYLAAPSFVEAGRILVATCRIFSCSMRDLVP